MSPEKLPLAAETLGFSPTLRNAFLMALAGPAKEVARPAEHEPPALVVIDADAPGIDAKWRAFHAEHPDCFAIAISAADKSPETRLEGVDAQLGKPLKIDELVKTVRLLIRQREEKRRLGNQVKDAPAIPGRGKENAGKPANIHGQAQSPNADSPLGFFDPANTLLGRLIQARNQAIAKEQGIEMTFKGHLLAIILPAGNWVQTAHRVEFFRPMCQSDAILKHIALAASLTPIKIDPSRAIDIEAFLWPIAAWTSAGRLPLELAGVDSVFLTRWPDLTRLPVDDEALDWAAFLLQRPVSLQAFFSIPASRPKSELGQFLACCWAIGVLASHRPGGEDFAPPAIAPNPEFADYLLRPFPDDR